MYESKKKGRVEIKKKFCVGCRLRHYQERLDHGTGFFFSSVILSIFKEIVTLNKYLSLSGLNVLIQLVNTFSILYGPESFQT